MNGRLIHLVDRAPGFKSLLETRRLDAHRVELTAPLRYRAQNGRVYVVPAGFRSDLDSRPTWLPGLLDVFMGTQLAAASAATLHDFLYREGRVSRREADALFYEALRLDHGRIGAGLLWLGVRLGGWAPWHAHRSAGAQV